MIFFEKEASVSLGYIDKTWKPGVGPHNYPDDRLLFYFFVPISMEVAGNV